MFTSHQRLQEGEPPPKKARKEKGSTQAASLLIRPEDLQAALQLIREEGSKEKPLTLVKFADQFQKKCGWRGDDGNDRAQFMAVALLVQGLLREEFKTSPYATNAYLVLAAKGARALEDASMLEDGESCNLASVSPGLQTPVHASTVVSAAQSAASIRAGSAAKRQDPLFQARVKTLQSLRVKLGQEAGLPGKFVLSDSEVSRLASESAASLGDLLPLPVAKRRLYGEAILQSLTNLPASQQRKTEDQQWHKSEEGPGR